MQIKRDHETAGVQYYVTGQGPDLVAVIGPWMRFATQGSGGIEQIHIPDHFHRFQVVGLNSVSGYEIWAVSVEAANAALLDFFHQPHVFWKTEVAPMMAARTSPAANAEALLRVEPTANPNTAPVKVLATDLLSKAAGHLAERAKTYDQPNGERSIGKTVEAFNTITGHDITEAQGWLLMLLLKQVRLFQRPGYHADSAEDAVAYAALLAEGKAREIS